MKVNLLKKIIPAIPYLSLIAVPFFIFWPLWLHPEAMAYDMADYFLPYRYFIGECLQQHQFPWWNPYTGMGVPMAADPQTGVFYPITWLTGYMAGYDFLTINLEYLLHIVIAGFGMYLLLRGLKYPVMICLWLAWSYQCCGFFVNNAQHYSWIISAAWLPFIFHYYRKAFLSCSYQDAVKTALSLFLFTTGGYPAFLIILLYLLGGHFCYVLAGSVFRQDRKMFFNMLKWSSVLLIIYLIITAPYIFSFLQGVPRMTRGEALIKGHTTFSAFTPQSMITFFLPAVPMGQNRDFNTDTSMTNVYIGLWALLFLVIGVMRTIRTNRRGIIFVTLLFFLIAMGDAFPVWPFLFDRVPFFDHIRFPAAFRLFVIMGCIVIAAEGMKAEQSRHSKTPQAVGLIFLLIVLLLCAVAACYNHNFMIPDVFSTAGFLKFFGESSTANNIVLQSILQLIPLTALLILIYSNQKWQSQQWYVLVTVVLLSDLFIASRINFTTIMSSPFPANALNEKIAQAPDGLPVWDAMTTVATTNIGDGSYAPSYFNNNLFRKQFARDAYSPFVLKLKSNLDHSPQCNSLLDRPVIYLTNHVQLTPPHPADNVPLNNRLTALTDELTLQQLTPATSDSVLYDLQLTSFANNQLVVQVHVNRQALLILQQTYYPGWKVTVNDKAADLLISNFCMMSVLLPAGDHTVDFFFDTTLTRWLLVISNSLLLLMLPLIFLFSAKIIRINGLNSPRE